MLCPGSSGLVGDEEHVVTPVAEHALEVVDDASAGTHAAGGNDDRRLATARETPHVGFMRSMIVDRDELRECERATTGAHACPRLGVPESLEALVFLREATGERGVEIDRQRRPALGFPASRPALPVDDVLQFVKQLLRATDAEGRHDDRSAIR